MMVTNLAVLLCLVSGTLAQWEDPDWTYHPKIVKSHNKYPPLPGSVPVYKLASKDKADPPAPPTKCSKSFSCADCNTAQVCRPSETGLVPFKQLACPTTAPYCNAASGSCSDVPDSTCGMKDDFVCPADGYYPDPTDCTIYHACNKFQSQKFQCAKGELYDPDNSVCSKTAVCNYNVQCAGVAQSKLQMGNTHFFTYCSDGTPLIVSRCQKEYKLNSTSQVCEAICEKNGLMEDAEDCTKFYLCKIMTVKPGLSFPVRENHECPKGEAFDPDAFQCVSSALTDCNKKP